MTPTAPDGQGQESHYVLGETLRPMLTNAMGSAIEIFDTKGIPGGGPPPHKHAWEEIYVVLSGEMDVSVDGKTRRLGPGGYAHVPANTPHAYKTLDHTHFLTIVSRGNASKFFKQVANEVKMDPPDIAGVLRVGADHGITFLV
jgi:quercetin dioxygenase-like cupin family protein